MIPATSLTDKTRAEPPGRILLACRPAAKDLRHHPAQAALLLLAITAATTTLTRALVLHGVTTGSSYQRTRAATAGPDVVVTNVPARFLPELTAREHDPGVTGHSGPYPVASAVMRAGRYATAVIAEGRNQAPAPVDHPKVTQGTWVRPGDVVLERDFADAPGIGAGDSVTFNGRPFRVAGVAVTAAFPPYPETGFMPHPTRESPELIWLTQADARSLATPARPLSSVQRAKSAPVLGDYEVTTHL